MIWYRLAARLGRSRISELQREISSRKFTEWKAFFEWEDTHQTKEDFYAAQIAAEVRRSYVKKPKTIKTKNFLLPVPQTMTQKQKHYLEQSKQRWAAFARIQIPKDPQEN